jgi:hypothetical protein
MRRLDDWLLDEVFAKIAREIESWTGINHWQLGRFFLLAWLAGLGTVTLSEAKVAAYVMFGIALLCAGVLIFVTFDMESRLRRTPSLNPWRYSLLMRLFRMGHLLFLILALPAVLTSETYGIVKFANNVTSTLLWFFVAIDALPPQERRLFQQPMPEAAR